VPRHLGVLRLVAGGTTNARPCNSRKRCLLARAFLKHHQYSNLRSAHRATVDDSSYHRRTQNSSPPRGSESFWKYLVSRRQRRPSGRPPRIFCAGFAPVSALLQLAGITTGATGALEQHDLRQFICASCPTGANPINTGTSCPAPVHYPAPVGGTGADPSPGTTKTHDLRSLVFPGVVFSTFRENSSLMTCLI
jgi:hypothetical protein